MKKLNNILIAASGFVILFIIGSCKKFDDSDCPACPCVIALDPAQAKPDDYIKIIGEKFGNNIEDIQVKFNDILSPEIASVKSSDSGYDTILAKVPLEYSSGSIEVIIRGLSTNDSTDKEKCNPVNFIWDPIVKLEAGFPGNQSFIDGPIFSARLYDPSCLSLDENESTVYFPDYNPTSGYFQLRRLRNDSILTISQDVDMSSWPKVTNKYDFHSMFLTSWGVPFSGPNIINYNGPSFSIAYVVPANFWLEEPICIRKGNQTMYFILREDIPGPGDKYYVMGHPEFSINSVADTVFTFVDQPGLVIRLDDLELHEPYLYLCYHTENSTNFSFVKSYVVKITTDINPTSQIIFESNNLVPVAIAFNNSNELYIAGEFKIFKVSNGSAIQIGGGSTYGAYNEGTLSEEKFGGIFDMKFTQNNKLYILDNGNSIIMSAQL